MRSESEGRAYLWNSIGGVLNAGQSVIVLMVITRCMGLAAAGVYSIAFATGNLFLYLGNYGVRNVQVSDLEEKYSFPDYILHRMLTVFLMAAVSAVFCLYAWKSGRYSGDKTIVVALMCLLKCTDCVEEVFEGRLQQRGRLDLAGKLMTVRLVVSVGGMILTVMLTKALIPATAAAVVLAAAAIAVMLAGYYPYWAPVPGSTAGKEHILALMKVCFPVCLSNFLTFYMINAPKYAIDALMNETEQARYNFIAMPVFVIQLLGMFVYQPVLVHMTIDWQKGDTKAFRGELVRIILWIGGIAAVCLAGAWAAGIPALSILYATDLSDLKAELMMILIGGAFLALNAFLCAVLTIIRRQGMIPAVYILGALSCLVIVRPLTASMGIAGGVLGFDLTTALASLLLSILVMREIHK